MVQERDRRKPLEGLAAAVGSLLVFAGALFVTYRARRAARIHQHTLERA